MNANGGGLKSCRLRAILYQVTQKLKRLPAVKGTGYNPLITYYPGNLLYRLLN